MLFDAEDQEDARNLQCFEDPGVIWPKSFY